MLRLFALLLIFDSPAWACPTLEESIRLTEEVLRANLFEVRRNLAEYRMVLGPDFERALEELGETGHWIDAGSGTARFAVDYFQHYTPGSARWPRLTAISVTEPARIPVEANQWNEMIIRAADRFRYLTNRIGSAPGELGARELGPAQLITDFYGAATYTRDLSTLLQIYGETLAPQGTLAIHWGGDTTFKRADGSAVSTADFLRSLRGFEIVSIRRHGFTLRRTTENLRIPALSNASWTQRVDGSSPNRVYEIP